MPKILSTSSNENKSEKTQTETPDSTETLETKPEAKAEIKAEPKTDPKTGAKAEESKPVAEFELEWKADLSVRVNVKNIMGEYPPYRMNIFSRKDRVNIAAANLMIEKFGALKEGPETVQEVYNILKEVERVFKPNNPAGEYNRRLQFCLTKIEAEYTSIKDNYKAPESVKPTISA